MLIFAKLTELNEGEIEWFKLGCRRHWATKEERGRGGAKERAGEETEHRTSRTWWLRWAMVRWYKAPTRTLNLRSMDVISVSKQPISIASSITISLLHADRSIGANLPSMLTRPAFYVVPPPTEA